MTETSSGSEFGFICGDCLAARGIETLPGTMHTTAVEVTCSVCGAPMKVPPARARISGVTVLEAEWRRHLDAADENDEDGGHVGLSHYHRDQARRIGDQIAAIRHATTPEETS